MNGVHYIIKNIKTKNINLTVNIVSNKYLNI